MKTRKPTQQEIDKLLSFKPLLYSEGFSPITGIEGGEEIEENVIIRPYPVYDEIVEQFFRHASRDCWMDYDYKPSEACAMLDDFQFIQLSDMDQLKTMITYCVRGERFCDGFWASMIEQGHILRLLERLETLTQETP